MLKSLPSTDLLACNPDADGIDLWSDSFDWKQIPAEIGCYAFYEAKTGIVVYIGSACARDSSPANVGLRMRLRFYKGRGNNDKPTSTIQKVLTTTKVSSYYYDVGLQLLQVTAGNMKTMR